MEQRRDELKARAEMAKRERDRLMEHAAQAIEDCHTIVVAMGLSSTATMAECVTRAKLAACADRLAKELEWYADENNYEEYQDHDPGCHPEGGCVGTCGEYLSDIDRDRGERARAALADAPESKPRRKQMAEALRDIEHFARTWLPERDMPGEDSAGRADMARVILDILEHHAVLADAPASGREEE
jgi:hypothetical protein